MEVFHSGQWGTICVNGWDTNDARVVCRELGYKYANVLPRDQVYPGSGKIWLDDVDCTGSEQSLTNCSHSGWGKHHKYCAHYWDVEVECSTTGKAISLKVRYCFTNAAKLEHGWQKIDRKQLRVADMTYLKFMSHEHNKYNNVLVRYKIHLFPPLF